jgi:cob(I)alamin adenosyltransferase
MDENKGRSGMSKIYTRTGDDGHTMLFGGVRVPKSDPSMELLGTLDELNSVAGWAASLSSDSQVRECLVRIQRQLFLIGAALAGEAASTSALATRGGGWVSDLEQEIDRFTSELPPLRHFILPGGAPSAAAIHVARAVARRSERVLFRWQSANTHPAAASIGIFLNRLGDWLFVLARLANLRSGESETLWRGGAGEDAPPTLP